MNPNNKKLLVLDTDMRAIYESSYLYAYHYAMQELSLIFYPWQAMSIVAPFYYPQMTRIRQVMRYKINRLRVHLTFPALSYQLHKGLHVAFFFNSDVTVPVLIFKTLPMSRTPDPFRVISIIPSFTPGFRAL